MPGFESIADRNSARRFVSKFFLKIFLALALSINSTANAQTIFSDLLTAKEWPQVRSGMAVLNLPPLRKMMNVYLASENATISLRYPGGDAGNAWAGEVREWLISLGVPSADLELSPGSRQRDALTLEVQKGPQRKTPVSSSDSSSKQKNNEDDS